MLRIPTQTIYTHTRTYTHVLIRRRSTVACIYIYIHIYKPMYISIRTHAVSKKKYKKNIYKPMYISIRTHAVSTAAEEGGELLPASIHVYHIHIYVHITSSHN